LDIQSRTLRIFVSNGNAFIEFGGGHFGGNNRVAIDSKGIAYGGESFARVSEGPSVGGGEVIVGGGGFAEGGEGVFAVGGGFAGGGGAVAEVGEGVAEACWDCSPYFFSLMQ